MLYLRISPALYYFTLQNLAKFTLCSWKNLLRVKKKNLYQGLYLNPRTTKDRHFHYSLCLAAIGLSWKEAVILPLHHSKITAFSSHVHVDSTQSKTRFRDICRSFQSMVKCGHKIYLYKSIIDIGFCVITLIGDKC